MPKEISGNLQSGGPASSNDGRVGNLAIPPDTAMQILATGKMHHAANVGQEADVLQALTILEYPAVDREGGQVLKNQDVLGAQWKSVAKIREANKMQELFREIGGKCAEIGKGWRNRKNGI